MSLWPPSDWARSISGSDPAHTDPAHTDRAHTDQAHTDGAGDPGEASRPVVVVTGASSGLGLAAAEALTAAGAEVVLAVRNRAKGEEAAARCRTVAASAATAGSGRGRGEAVVAELDVARPDSVADFAAWFTDSHPRLDLLINNAGVMAPPPSLTPEGVELQWATNHLGHFALVGRLLEPLSASPDSRVVAVSSLAAGTGRLRGYDPTSLVGYSRIQSYANSKLANLVFALELDRRLRRAGRPTIAVAAHPGVTHTNLSSGVGGPAAKIMGVLSRVTTQPVSQGVQPILRAATDPAVVGGDYLGPAGFRQYRGRAVLIEPPASAADPTLGPELWAASVELSGVDYLAD